MATRTLEPRRYTSAAVTFHWLIALLIIANVTLAWVWPTVAGEGARPLINSHKSIGIVVLGLAVMRLLWRWTHRPPPHPSTMQAWEARLASVTHVLLYVIIFAMPLTGWIFDSAWDRAAQNPLPLFGSPVVWPRIGFIEALDPDTKKQVHDWFETFHVWLSYALYGLFALHVAGALKHQFVDREPELRRMWYR